MEKNNEYLEKLVHINRITKVVKGGRRFGFSALVVVGNQNGKIGIAHAKAKQVPDAIKKANDELRQLPEDFSRRPYIRFSHVGEIVFYPNFANSLAKNAQVFGASYIAFGSFFNTKTKEKTNKVFFPNIIAWNKIKKIHFSCNF